MAHSQCSVDSGWLVLTLAQACVMVLSQRLLTCLLKEEAPKLRSNQKTCRKVVRDSTPQVSEMLLCPPFRFLPITRANELWPELKQVPIAFLRTCLAGWGHMQHMKEACAQTSSLLEIHFDCGSKGNPSRLHVHLLKPAHAWAFPSPST